jgi:hypothetical protein
MVNQGNTASGCLGPDISKSSSKNSEDKTIVLLPGSELHISCCQDWLRNPSNAVVNTASLRVTCRLCPKHFLLFLGAIWHMSN